MDVEAFGNEVGLFLMAPSGLACLFLFPLFVSFVLVSPFLVGDMLFLPTLSDVSTVFHCSGISEALDMQIRPGMRKR
jgi:hypothetical protein